MLLGSKNSLRRNLLALLIASPWLLMALVRLLALDFFWPLIPFVAFTPQTTVVLAVLLVVALLLRARWAALGILAAIVAMALVLIPRATGDAQPAAAGRTLTVFTANLRLGQADPGPLAAAIKRVDPDVIALQEASPWALDQLKERGIDARYPYLIDHSWWGSVGYATFSKRALTVVPGSGLGADGDWPEMRIAGTGVIFRNVHPAPPVRPDVTPSWQRNLDAIPGSAGRTRIIAGDFNATLDHRAFRAVLARGYRDSGDITGNGFEWTWTAGRLRRLVLDHVLIPPGVAARDYRVFDLPNSDHNAVAVTLRLPH